jgi:hypothetical protein
MIDKALRTVASSIGDRARLDLRLPGGCLGRKLLLWRLGTVPVHRRGLGTIRSLLLRGLGTVRALLLAVPRLRSAVSLLRQVRRLGVRRVRLLLIRHGARQLLRRERRRDTARVAMPAVAHGDRRDDGGTGARSCSSSCALIGSSASRWKEGDLIWSSGCFHGPRIQ